MSEPTDYQYDDEKVVLTDNKADNRAESLEGYELDIRPEANWPGLKGPKGGELYFDTEAAQAVADWLGDQLEVIQQAVRLALHASGANFGPGTWIEANNLGKASSEVALTVADYSAQLRQSVDTASKSIAAAAKTIGTADHTTWQGVQNVDSNLHSGGATRSNTDSVN